MVASVEEKASGAGEVGEAVHGGRLVAQTLRSRGRRAPLHALRRPPVLDLRRLQRGGHRARRRPPRAVGGLRRRGLREGDPPGRGRGADRRARGDQRDQRDRRGRRRTARRSACSAAGRRRCAGARARCRRSTTCRFVSPLVKSAETVKETARIAALTAAALDLALAAPSGPTFVDYPLDVVFTRGRGRDPRAARGRGRAAGSRGRGGGGAAGRRRAAGDHGRHRPLLGPAARRSCGRWPRRSGSRSSSTASAAAACPPTTSSPSAAPAAPGSRGPTSRW